MQSQKCWCRGQYLDLVILNRVKNDTAETARQKPTLHHPCYLEPFD